MAGFRVVNRPMVLPADLGIIERSYNQLEQGHQNTIAAASKYKTELAQLDLAPEEDAWRQQQFAKIDSALNNNMLYGNAYTAMDDVNKAIGDIESDPGMIGRLRYQAQRKEWLNALNASNLSEDYKDYYRKANPYAYKDKVDETGKVIGGNSWEPKETWTESIDFGKIIAAGIASAKPDSASGNSIRFIDANGNVTTDASKSVDGEYYDDTTNSWVRLGSDKIKAGIMAYLEATPGAMASVMQDYKIAKYRHAENPEVNYGITDPNGITLSFKDYIARRVDNVAYAASYTQTISKRTIGKGLATYKAGLSNVTNGRYGSGTNYASYFANGPVAQIQYGVDMVSNYQQRRTTGITNINTMLNTLNPNGKYNFTRDTDYNTIETAIKTELENYKGNDKKQYIEQLYSIYNDVISASNDYNAAVEGLNETQKNDIDFVTRVQNGGTLERGKSKYDDKVLNDINNMFGENATNLNILIRDPNVYTTFKSIIDGNEVDGYNNLGNIKIKENSNGEHIVSIPKEEYNTLILMSKALNNSYEQHYSKLGDRLHNSINKIFGNEAYKIYLTDDEGNDATNISLGIEGYGFVQTNNNSEIYFNRIGKTYDKAIISTKEAVSENVPMNIRTPVVALPGTTFEQGDLVNRYQKGLIDATTYNTLSKAADKNFDQKLMSHQFHLSTMYIMDNKTGKILTEVKDPNDRILIGNAIQQTNQKKSLYKTPAIASGVGSGYLFNALPLMSSSGGKLMRKNLIGTDYGNNLSTSENISVFVPGLLSNEVNESIERDPGVKAASTVNVMDQVGNTISLYNGKSLFGEPLRLKGNKNGTFTFSSGFNDTNTTINKDQAEALIKSSVEFEELVKAGKLIQAGYGDQQTIIRAQYLVNSIAQELSLIYGINPTMAAAAIISNAGIPITQ